jgi:hypothetical protein
MGGIFAIALIKRLRTAEICKSSKWRLCRRSHPGPYSLECSALHNPPTLQCLEKKPVKHRCRTTRVNLRLSVFWSMASARSYFCQDLLSKVLDDGKIITVWQNSAQRRSKRLPSSSRCGNDRCITRCCAISVGQLKKNTARGRPI